MSFLGDLYFRSLVIVDMGKKEHLKKFKIDSCESSILFIFFDKYNNKAYFDDRIQNRSYSLELKNVLLLLTTLNKKIESSSFIEKIIDFLNVSKNEKRISFGEHKNHKLKVKLSVIVNKDSETLDCDLLFNYIKLFKIFDFSFYRNDNNNFENFLHDDYIYLKNSKDFKKKIYDKKNSKKELSSLDNNNKDDKNDKIDLYKDVKSVIKFIDYLINDGDIYFEKISGLVDYGNLLYNCNLLKNRYESTSSYCCNCDDKIDHLNNYHKIKLKIIEFYILKPSNKKISFNFDNFLYSEDNYLKWAGVFLHRIKKGILKLDYLEISKFVSSWVLIIDGIDILKNIMNNKKFKSSSSITQQISSHLNEQYILSYDNDKYILKHPYLPSNLINKQHIKTRENPFARIKLKGDNTYTLCVKHFLDVLLRNNILFKDIFIEFQKFDLKYNNYLKDSEDCYDFFINFIEKQHNIKKLELYNSFDYDKKIGDLCHSLYGKEISFLTITCRNLNEDGVDDVCDLIKNSYLKECYCFEIGFLDETQIEERHNKISKILSIPIKKRTIPLKTITNVKSAAKRDRDDDDDDYGSFNNNAKFFRKDI